MCQAGIKQETGLYNVKRLHIELTDKCQAACPMCARNHNGYSTRPFIKNTEIGIKDFKQWFPPEFLQTLTNFYSSGNYGDPAFATDCLEIYKYIKESNPDIYSAMHTNGSLRKPEWWAELAQYINEVTFAVDGFKGKHELYRRNTDFDKVIENIKAFVAAGGKANVNSLVFAHNEDDVEELEKFLLGIGVSQVQFRHTTRFYSVVNFPVFDSHNKFVYNLQPSKNTKVTEPLEKLLDSAVRDDVVDKSVIDPKCVNLNEVFVDCRGNLFPCSYLGSDYVEEPLNEITVINALRNISIYTTKQHLNKLTVPNLYDAPITEVLTDNLWNNLPDLWSDKKCLTCVNTCSKNS
jgi:MoaA/NifB/PqqE/SkfB family radical SAM enzyme